MSVKNGANVRYYLDSKGKVLTFAVLFHCPVVLDLIDFFLYGMYSKKFNYEQLSGTYKDYKINEAAIKIVEYMRKPMRKALKQSLHFDEPSYIWETAEAASKIDRKAHV